MNKFIVVLLALVCFSSSVSIASNTSNKVLRETLINSAMEELELETQTCNIICSREHKKVKYKFMPYETFMSKCVDTCIPRIKCSEAVPGATICVERRL